MHRKRGSKDSLLPSTSPSSSSPSMGRNVSPSRRKRSHTFEIRPSEDEIGSDLNDSDDSDDDDSDDDDSDLSESNESQSEPEDESDVSGSESSSPSDSSPISEGSSTKVPRDLEEW